jgi:hypothetical protein
MKIKAMGPVEKKRLLGIGDATLGLMTQAI